jgi:hypothetical protein
MSFSDQAEHAMPMWRTPGQGHPSAERSTQPARVRPRRRTRARGWLAGAGAVAAVTLASTGVAVAGAWPGSGASPASARAAGLPQAAGGQVVAAPALPRVAVRVRPSGPHTSCRSVAHIGDSTSADLVSPAYLPDPAQRLAARYADVGVASLRVDASGGRSIVEVLPGQVNGYNVARAWRDEGYRGCWVFALGTNDAANVLVGSAVGLSARIDRMMSVAHGEPVMWVSTRTQLSGGPWAESQERRWDDALRGALARYPNMRIFNWAAVAKPGWFLADGIHYTSPGCAIRARAIALALARAFPRYGHSRGDIVS